MKVEKQLTKDDLLRFLREIEKGQITLTPLQDPQDVYAGVVPYRASNGWQIEIFNDANEWDYVEKVVTASGRQYNYGDFEGDREVEFYEPTVEVAWKQYGIPGDMIFRCVRCGDQVKLRKPPFICNSCNSVPSA